MAKITRKTQKIFGGNSSNNAQYGSARAGTFVFDNDPDVIQALPAWESGINAATVSGQNLPALEEEQGVTFVATRQIAYILQEGIAEYDSGTEYHINSVVKMAGTVVIYASVADNNAGNPLSDVTKWKRLCDLATVQPLNNYTAVTDPTVNDDITQGYSAGSYWYNTITGDTFFLVNPAVGAANWILQTAISPSDLGSAAFEDVAFFAVASQGAKADSVDTLLKSGAAGQTLISNGALDPVWSNRGLTTPVVKPTTSGGAVLFSGSEIPANVKKITIGFDQFSTNGTNIPKIRLGTSGGVLGSGYTGSGGYISGTGLNSLGATDAFNITQSWSAANVLCGTFFLTLIDSVTNTWSISSVSGYSSAAGLFFTGGTVTLPAVLDRLQVLTTTPNEFDSGKISIVCEV